MTLKNWNEYTEEEKISLLNHHYYYYGKTIITFNEMEELRKTISKNPDLMWKIAVLSFINNVDCETLVIRTFRTKQFKELCNSIPKSLNKESQELFDAYEQELLRQTVETFNNPKSAIPMSEDKIIKDLREIIESQETSESSKKVYKPNTDK